MQKKRFKGYNGSWIWFGDVCDGVGWSRKGDFIRRRRENIIGQPEDGTVLKEGGKRGNIGLRMLGEGREVVERGGS